MILQISDDNSIIIRCHTFKHSPKMHDFHISIQENHLFICRNSGEEMKIFLGDHGKPHLPVRINSESKENFSKLIKSKPLKKGVVLIKLEKE